MTSRKVCLYAVNVHSGGGAVLLNEAVASFRNAGDIVLLIVDERFQLKIDNDNANDINIIYVSTSIKDRLIAEFTYRGVINDCDLIFFFGNLPPFHKFIPKSYLFMQNRFLVDNDALGYLDNTIVKYKLIVEKFIFNHFNKNVDEIIVQTKTMQNLVLNSINRKAEIIPFIATDLRKNKRKINVSEKVFLFVASGEMHKNHLNLIKAWDILAKNNVFPKLYLTLSEIYYSRLLKLVDRKVNVINLGSLNRDQLQNIYNDGAVLIYPSFVESLGLPLLEAKELGLDIIASELDYVRDIVNPIETFDPKSPISIARSVIRYLDLDKTNFQTLDIAKVIGS